ncbi:MAG: acyltransferase family protein [Clostridia bacterium]|nr:acyltransferase family protein [Clostridia bacterium]
MIFFLAALLVLCVIGIKFSGKNGFEDYMSPQKTGAIKGIFVIIVLFSHVRQYITLTSEWYDKPFTDFMLFLGQLMVVMFLFYSGYGVTLGLAKKDGYVKSLISKRALKVLLHYDIAILIFYFLGLALGKNYTIKKLLLSFIGLDAVGNSVWFIFVILILYIITWISFLFVKKKAVLGTAITTVLSVAAVVVLWLLKGKEYWWYDTLLCYPLGMCYAISKPYIDKALVPSFGKWAISTGITLAAFITLNHFFILNGKIRAIFIPMALVFTLLTVLLSMRISINNGVLRWFGKRVFGIYILQRIPMIILQHFGMNDSPLLFAAVSFAVTIVLAEIFERGMDKLDSALKLSK